jgi:hypothetical protein
MANIFNFSAWSQRRTALREAGAVAGTAAQDSAHVGDIQGAFGTVRAGDLDRSPTWSRRLRYLMAASSYPDLGCASCPGNLRGYQEVAVFAGRSAAMLADAVYGIAVHGLGAFARDKALLEFISGMAKMVAAVAELLAFFPPLAAVFGPVAVAAAVAALGADVLLAGFHHGSWRVVALNAAAMAPDVGWMRAISKLADMYKLAGLCRDSGLAGPVTQVRTLTGLVIGKTAEAAPGMFRMIGDSLKTATAGVDTGMKAIPGTVRAWASKVAAGQAPWQESASKATGLVSPVTVMTVCPCALARASIDSRCRSIDMLESVS